LYVAGNGGTLGTMSLHTFVIGAGLTGLSCAHHLKGPSTIIEKLREVGGEARTHRRGAYLFDCTGHWLHMRDADMRGWIDQVMGPALQEIHRRAAVYSHGAFRAYPFQAHTHGLPAEVIEECLLGFVEAQQQQGRAPRSLQDFIVQRLGTGFAKHFMVPYNTKLWTVPPAELSAQWCERFVPVPTLQQVVRGALTAEGDRSRLGYNATFLYPRSGGMGALAAALAAQLPSRVRLRHSVWPTRLDLAQRRLFLNTGESHAYHTLVSTMPLPQLLALCGPLPEYIETAMRALRAVSVTYWDIGLHRPELPVQPPPAAVGSLSPHDYHWVYYPSAHLPFYRTGSASAVCRGMAPAGHVSLCVEVAHRQGTACSATDADIVRGLVEVGLMQPYETPDLWQRSHIDTAYVIMDAAYGPARKTLLGWLQSFGVLAAGRYGAWHYDSMEGALIAGRQTAYALNAQACA
jgi:protoporphyrinogen oxidase